MKKLYVLFGSSIPVNTEKGPPVKPVKERLFFTGSKRNMKKIFVFLIIITSLTFSACQGDESDTEVTISNQSSRVLYSVVWNGFSFGFSSKSNFINPGDAYTLSQESFSSSSIKKLSGSGYVFFYLEEMKENRPTQYHSRKILTVAPGEVVTFYITNDSIPAVE
jgi:hypothetical protein